MQLNQQRDMDLQKRTLQDLGLVLGQTQMPVPESLPGKIQQGIKNTLGRAKHIINNLDSPPPIIDDLGPPLPCIVFCDDAQFARQDGDLSAHAFLKELYERAHHARWPLLLVLTHWQLDWDEARCAWESAQQAQPDAQQQTATADDIPASRLGPSLAYELQRFIHEDDRPCVEIPIPKEEAALQDIVTANLPALPMAQVQLLLDKADGNPQMLIELVQKVRRAPAWFDADGHLTAAACRAIEGMHLSLTQLILDRLESGHTPQGVREAAALSSLQGMQFLRV